MSRRKPQDPLSQRVAKFQRQGYQGPAARALAERELREETAAKEEADRKAREEAKRRRVEVARARGEYFLCPDCSNEFFAPQGVMPTHNRYDYALSDAGRICPGSGRKMK